MAKRGKKKGAGLLLLVLHHIYLSVKAAFCIPFLVSFRLPTVAGFDLVLHERAGRLASYIIRLWGRVTKAD